MAEEKINSQNLIEILVSKHGLSKENAEIFLKEFFDLIEEGLKKEHAVKIKGFGTFKLIEVKSRESINVNTGERFEIQGHTKVSFTPESSLRDLINKPFAHFETVVLNDGVTFDDQPSNKETYLNDEYDDDSHSEDLPSLAVIPPVIPDAENTIPEPDIEIPEPDNLPPATEEEDIVIPEEPVIASEETIITSDEDTIDKQIVEEDEVPEIKVPDKVPSNGFNAKAVLIAILLTLIVCGAAIIFVFFPGFFDKSDKKSNTVKPDTEIIHPVKKTDTVAVVPVEDVKKDSVVIIHKQQENKVVDQKPQEVSFRNDTPVRPDSTSYDITGTRTTHTIQPGETLTRVALRFYGTKDLWPYLVMHNKDKITNPNNVPVGVTIRIPELKKK